ncbi:MAG: ferrochelatase [Actinomycetota bacterium]|nr:ferrochelatase [Actinomycetota bacterium]
MNKTALLYLSFGGPNTDDEILPFMENVTRGRNIPKERLVEVSKHYYLFGGKSPINEINLDIIERLKTALKERGLLVDVYFGNRNWEPYVKDAISQIERDGHSYFYYFATSAYSSYSGCRQYREDVARSIGENTSSLEAKKLPHFYNRKGFLEPFIDDIVAKVASLELPFEQIEICYSAHSVPISMVEASFYSQQLEQAISYIHRKVSDILGFDISHARVYQSRSGPPNQPWLEPDISDHMASLQGKKGVISVPVGFISDHMEVIYDLDTLAKENAEKLNLKYLRVSTPSSSPLFVEMIVDLLEEEMDPGIQRRTIAEVGEPFETCGPRCCLVQRPSN